MSSPFKWVKFDADSYRLDEPTTGNPDPSRVLWKGQGLGWPGSHFPVIGDLEMAEGKFYWRVHVMCDNFKIGLATADCPLDKPIGTTPHSWFVDMSTGDCFGGTEDCATRSILVPAPNVIARLHKLVAPSTGGVCGFKLDLEEGTFMFYFNDEYMGTIIRDPNLKSQGPFYPAVGITGLEGRAATILTEEEPVPKLYNYKRNKL